MTFAISSPSFSNGRKIPTKFTCDGSDVSPALSWTTPPPGTQSFTLIADDPGAPVGTWTHWVLFDLPTHASALPDGVSKVDEVSGGVGVRVATTFARSAMAVPARLPAKPIAISSNSMLWTECFNLKPGASKRDVEQAMLGHILGEAELMGTYQR
jgi:hypothetical protein